MCFLVNHTIKIITGISRISGYPHFPIGILFSGMYHPPETLTSSENKSPASLGALYRHHTTVILISRWSEDIPDLFETELADKAG